MHLLALSYNLLPQFTRSLADSWCTMFVDTLLVDDLYHEFIC